MKYAAYLIIGIIIALLVYFGIFSRRPSSTRTNQTEPFLQQTTGWESQTSSQPPITVRVTPLELGKMVSAWKFQVVLDTHTENLNDSLLQAAVLETGDGAIYRPAAWEGSGPGGHHREGVLIFQPIKPSPSYAELKLKNIGGVPERSFRWNLQ
jgi:hypothetical protein